MTEEQDKALGMDRAISRRDFVQGTAVAVALGASGLGRGEVTPEAPAGVPDFDGPYYPPTRTGMRGSHPGSFETAHALARSGAGFEPPEPSNETYDLVVVGGGISGLAAAHYYRSRFGETARILILDNHDDFGGHAKRNEFHQGGRPVLSLGGTHNLEWWAFSDTVNDLLAELGIDIEAMRGQMTFRYGLSAPNSPAFWFDKDTYGSDRLLTGFSLSSRLSAEQIEQLPISSAGRDSLHRFYSREPVNVTAEAELDVEELMFTTSYPDFLREYGGLTDDAVQLFDKAAHGAWGVEMRALSVRQALEEGLPGGHLLGMGWSEDAWDYPVAMWPDGNASLARLLVARLIPDVASGVSADNVAISAFDYAKLDQAGATTQLRLNATVVNVANRGKGTRVTYVKEGTLQTVAAKHTVLACYHSVIPHICPSLPAAQKDALAYQVKIPLILTNVLIRNTRALDKLGVDAVSCPGRLHARLFLFRGINTGGYQHREDDDGPVSLVFWGSVSPSAEAGDLKQQLRSSREKLLALSFADFEREVRTVLHGLLGPAGFDVQDDILAITVNRWPHGYAYEYMDLWDPQWPQGQAPHEVARQPAGHIAIANSDAGASAYTHVAIDQAWRAVQELPG